MKAGVVNITVDALAANMLPPGSAVVRITFDHNEDAIKLTVMHDDLHDIPEGGVLPNVGVEIEEEGLPEITWAKGRAYP